MAGIQALCITTIQRARWNIKCRTGGYPTTCEPEDDALWLLTDARDLWMPLAYGDKSEHFYRIIRSEVLRSEGFRRLLKTICDPCNPDGEILARELDRYG